MALVLFTILSVVGMVVWTVYFTHWSMITEHLSDPAARLMIGDVFRKINFLLLIELPLVLF
jgi:hypothetical protein